jgi:hypothetical protein
VVEELRDGPISMPKDQEWIHFVTHDDQFLDPTIPLRTPDQIHYPGQDHVAAQEIRAGLLERKSKYLKSYTAGWYVLSTTHLHEFKSADKGQAPVMSLYLPEQKLGSHSNEGGSSNKFILKGRQTGTMHRGHTWVFRAESHDTMMAWYEDIKALTEKTPAERSQFVRTHSRSLSRSSRRSASSDGLADDDDDEPFSAGSQIDVNPGPKQDAMSRRSQPGGRFPSDIQVNAQRGLQASRSRSSLSSGGHDQDTSDAQLMAAAGALPGSGFPPGPQEQDPDRQHGYGYTQQTPIDAMPSHAALAHEEAQYDGVNPYTSEPVQQQPHSQGQDGLYVAPTIIPQSHQDPVGGADDRLQQSRGLDGVAEPMATPQPADGQHVNGGVDSVKVLAVGAVKQPSALVPTPEPSEVPTTPMTDDLLLTQTPTEASFPARPTSNRNDSVNTISNLPIPGGYPRNSIA